ncbi:unnamed protein product [Rhizophagus irregularis]|nr:unnamed protein product [Rhizophagus irregularis]
MQSIDSLRELNAKLLAEIAELRKENAEIPELREKHDAENAELKSRVGELEARLALLEQSSAVDGMVFLFGQIQNGEEAMPVVTLPTVDVPDSIIDQLNNEASD